MSLLFSSVCLLQLPPSFRLINSKSCPYFAFSVLVTVTLLFQSWLQNPCFVLVLVDRGLLVIFLGLTNDSSSSVAPTVLSSSASLNKSSFRSSAHQSRLYLSTCHSCFEDWWHVVPIVHSVKMAMDYSTNFDEVSSYLMCGPYYPPLPPPPPIGKYGFRFNIFKLSSILTTLQQTKKIFNSLWPSLFSPFSLRIDRCHRQYQTSETFKFVLLQLQLPLLLVISSIFPILKNFSVSVLGSRPKCISNEVCWKSKPFS